MDYKDSLEAPTYRLHSSPRRLHPAALLFRQGASFPLSLTWSPYLAFASIEGILNSILKNQLVPCLTRTSPARIIYQVVL